MNIRQLAETCEKQGLILDETMQEQLKIYMDLLIETNQHMNLTAIDDPEEIVEKHFYDCLLPFFHTKIQGYAADVGSGAGFPGLVWKIARPELSMVLFEPTGKRASFLQKVIDTLNLSDIKVENKRAEDAAKEYRETFDVVTARAVASLPLLSELCVPLVKKNGVFLAMKGAQGHDEVNAAENAADVLGISLEKVTDMDLTQGDKRTLIVYRKVKNTPAKYPRNYGQMKKKPL